MNLLVFWYVFTGGSGKGSSCDCSRTGVWELFSTLGMTSVWVADSVETLPWGTKGAFCGVAKLCFVSTQQYMLNECVYFHQWHTRAARSAQGYQFINFYSGFRCPLNSNLSCRWSGISCFHLLKFKQFGYKEISPNKIWPHLPGVLEKEMAAHSSVLAWRIPGTGEPGGFPSLGSHRVGHDWSDLAAAAAAAARCVCESGVDSPALLFHIYLLCVWT